MFANLGGGVPVNFWSGQRSGYQRSAKVKLRHFPGYYSIIFDKPAHSSGTDTGEAPRKSAFDSSLNGRLSEYFFSDLTYGQRFSVQGAKTAKIDVFCGKSFCENFWLTNCTSLPLAASCSSRQDASNEL